MAYSVACEFCPCDFMERELGMKCYESWLHLRRLRSRLGSSSNTDMDFLETPWACISPSVEERLTKLS
jgi:hypothetical protein